MAAILLGNTEIIDSGTTSPIVLPVNDLPIPNVVVLDEVIVLNNNSSTPSGGGAIIRISDLVSGAVINANLFYEYNDVIYRAVSNHIYNGTFISGNFVALGVERIEVEVFTVTNNSTTVLTLSTPVGKLIGLEVNGISYIEGIDFTKSGTSNSTLTFTEALPYDADFAPTYVKVTTVPTNNSSGGSSGDSASIRTGSNVTATGVEQTVSFSSTLGTTAYSLSIQMVPDLGIEYITKGQTGFTIKFANTGTFDYTAIKNI